MENIDITAIITSIITALASVAGAYSAIRKGNHDKEKQDAIREERYNHRIDTVEEKILRLEKKVDEHNGYAEKFAQNSEKLAVLATKIESIEKKI